MRGIVADLMPASGHQDHTTSPSATAPFVLEAPSTSTASRLNVRDDRETPLEMRRDRIEIFLFLPGRQARFWKLKIDDEGHLVGWMVFIVQPVGTARPSRPYPRSLAGRAGRTTGLLLPETPHPPSLREGTLSRKGRGPVSAELDLVGNLMRKADATKRENHLGRQLLVAL
jgi:hypothetical protein